MMDDWFDSEIFASPLFWIPIVVAGVVLAYVLNEWKDTMDGVMGYGIVGFVATVIFAYFWAMRKMDE